MTHPEQSNSQTRSYTIGHRIALRVAATLSAAAIYLFDRRVLGLDQGLSVVLVVVGFLWWAVVE